MVDEPQNIKISDSKIPVGTALEEAVRIESRKFDPLHQPNIDSVRSAILVNGTIAHKAITHWTIRDQHTGQPHHHQLTIFTLRTTKKSGTEIVTKNTITLGDGKGDDIQKLFDFLASLPLIQDEGNYIVINPEHIDDHRFRQILDAISSSDQTIELLSEILSWINGDVKAKRGLIQLTYDHPIRTKSLIAALNYARYRRALDKLKLLIEENHSEQIYQKFLEQHFWMFGSEYSELVDKRALALGIQLDFPLRRTVDGYLDIIEIKKPTLDKGKSLYKYDDSHKTLYMGDELSKAIAQIENYLAVLEAEQYRIMLLEQLKVEKVRGKIVIGRDETAEQVKALRRLNSDKRQVEVITYDQLVRIAERILAILAEENEILDEEIDIPLSTENSQVSDIDEIPF